jgi:hypothetical protein
VAAGRDQAEITVMAAGALEPGLDNAAAAFAAATGTKVRVSYLHDLKVADVAILPEETLEKSFRREGRVEKDETYVGRSPGLGVGIRRGARIPGISTLAAFMQSLVDADHVLLTEHHVSSIHVESVLRQHGVFDKIEGRIRRAPHGPYLIDLLLEGDGDEVMVLPINAIRACRDERLLLVGPLPEGIQKNNRFLAAPMTGSANKQAARAFARYCGADGRRFFVENGFS